MFPFCENQPLSSPPPNDVPHPPNFQDSESHHQPSLDSYLRALLNNQKEGKCTLTPLTEQRIHDLLNICTRPSFNPSHIPAIMDEMNTLLYEGDKYADAIQKLQTMELEWFDLRFSEYTSFNGLSIARIMARETLRRLTRRHDAIQVTKLWNRDPNSQQTPGQLSPADIALDLFERGSWDLIHQILDREGNLLQELEEIRRTHAARIEIKPQTKKSAFKLGPMTALVQRLAAHTLDSFFDVRTVIADYVVQRDDSHVENERSIKQLTSDGLFYNLAGKLAHDLNTVDSLPHVVDEARGTYIKEKILKEIKLYFEKFWIDGESRMVRDYIVHPAIYGMLEVVL